MSKEETSALATTKKSTINKKTPSIPYLHANYEKMCKDEEDFDKCCNFVMYLGEKIVRRGYQVELNEFLNLVNVNGFYKGVQKQSAGQIAGSSSAVVVGAGDNRKK